VQLPMLWSSILVESGCPKSFDQTTCHRFAIRHTREILCILPPWEPRICREFGTIVTIIRKFLKDNPSQWDKLLPYVLFALRGETQLYWIQCIWDGIWQEDVWIIDDHERHMYWQRSDGWTVEWKNMSTVEHIEQLNERIESIHKISQEN